MRKFDRGDLTLRELSEMTGKSIRQLSRKTSKPRHVYLRQTANRHQEVLHLKKQGRTPREIADLTGYSLSNVYNILSTRQIPV